MPKYSPSHPPERNVLNLGLVSLCNDLASEVLARLVPLYVTGILGAPMSAVGAIEGIADSTATLLKPVFGALSDRLGKRKGFITLGYALSALARPLLALTGSWPEVAFLRFCDRLGKGVRTAPRDALIANTGSPSRHGRNFGLNRALDTLGALLGVTAFGVWTQSHGEVALTQKTWIWLCILFAIPGLLAVLLSIFGVREVLKTPSDKTHSSPARLSGTFRRYLLVVGLFGLANSSDAFILLRARELGYGLPAILGMIGLFNLVSALTAIPAAALSDRMGRRTLIAMGWSIYALSYAIIGSPWVQKMPWLLALMIAVYGLFFGFTESVERAWVADLSTAPTRGRAYGAFGLVVGLAALPASTAFGWAWDRFGSEVPFYAASTIALMSISLLFALVPGTPIHHADPSKTSNGHNAQ
ncbi:MFS transporter [Bdellovibrionota bacterium FG-1]